MFGFLLMLVVVTSQSPCDLKGETMLECYARTGYFDRSYDYRLWDLATVSADDYLPVLWEYYSETINISDFRNAKYDGIVNYLYFDVLGKTAFTTLVGNWTEIFANKLTSELITFQKTIYENDDEYGRSGINYWCSAKKTKLPMKIYNSPAFQGYGFTSLKVDYDVKGNIYGVETPFIDEIRLIKGTKGLYLGKMYFRVLGNPVFVLWFSMEKR